MLGVTTYLTTDISAIPFFWVIPLALYLLTFILVFARWPVLWVGWPHTILLFVQPCFLMWLVLVKIAELPFIIPFHFCFHLIVFFTTALVCHGELAKNRPAARHLTDFYLCMALGGVLGGMFNALIAPVFFGWASRNITSRWCWPPAPGPPRLGNTPLMPGDSNREESTPLGWFLNVAIPVGFGVAAYYLAGLEYILKAEWYRLAAATVLVLVLMLSLLGRSWRFGLSLGCLLLGGEIYNWNKGPFPLPGPELLRLRQGAGERHPHHLSHLGPWRHQSWLANCRAGEPPTRDHHLFSSHGGNRPIIPEVLLAGCPAACFPRGPRGGAGRFACRHPFRASLWRDRPGDGYLGRPCQTMPARGLLRDRSARETVVFAPGRKGTLFLLFTRCQRPRRQSGSRPGRRPANA